MDQHRLATRGDNAGLWDWNLATNRVHFSPRWISIVGSDPHQVGNTPDAWFTRVHPDDIGDVRRRIDEHLAGGPCEFDLPHRLLHRDGTYRWTACHGVVVRNEEGRAVRVMGCHSDVTAEKVADALTGLPNRRLFMDHLGRAIERARRNPAHHFAVLLLDLGRADRLEDDAGAATPDPLLTAAARRLETCLRAGDGKASLSRDHLVARLRGDEFAILLDGLAEVGDARVVAERVLSEVLSSFMIGGDEVFLSASIGIAVGATGYTVAEAMVRDAGTALYRARLLGRSRCEVFDTAILRSAQSELQLGDDFQDALARREFLIVFQPVVSLATHRIAGFEALVRWQHPTRGFISPGEFIPIAEQTGFIVPLGQWTLREACLQLKVWQESLPAAEDVWVSVNLSSPQFNHPTLVGEITQALRDVGLPARCLVVELTEGVAIENPAAAKGLLMQLRMMGVKVALDDFGTGQSSLAYLHQFPADKLKLDRSFVCDMEIRKDVRDIVGAVTGLAHHLGLEVIAEGVENEAQLALVRSMGCDYVQGFYYSKPVDSERATDLLRSGFSPEPESRTEADTVRDVLSMERPVVPAPVVRGPRIAEAIYVLAAALATIALAGLVTRFAFQPPAAPASPSAAIERMALVTHGPAATGSGVTSPSEPAGTADAAAEAARTATKSMARSILVVHKHTLRDCRGQLTLSQAGLAFVPEKEEDRRKDAFSLKYSEFRYSASDDDLTIQTKAKTYRFKAADATGKNGIRMRPQEIAQQITRLRGTSTAK